MSVCVTERGRNQFPSVLLQPLGHLSVSFESAVYRLVAEPTNPNCDTDCDRPRMWREHVRGFGLLGDPKPPERNRPTPAFQYRTQGGIPVRLKPLSLTRPTANRRLHDRPTLAPRVTRSSSSCSNVSTIASAAPEAGSVESFLRGIELVQDQQRLAAFLLEGHRRDGPILATLLIRPDESRVRCHFEVLAEERHRFVVSNTRR